MGIAADNGVGPPFNDPPLNLPQQAELDRVMWSATRFKDVAKYVLVSFDLARKPTVVRDLRTDLADGDSVALMLLPAC